MPSTAPPGFETIEAPRATVILRRDRRDALLRAGIDDPEGLIRGGGLEGRLEGGRAPHGVLRLGDDRCVLKAYRRGGMLGRWNRDRYWGRERFLAELGVAAAAAEAEVPTADVLALILRPAGWGAVRVWLVTRLVEGARPIIEVLGSADEADAFRAAGRAVAAMHAAGIDHPDLHLDNILVERGPRGCRASIIDWDRARLRAPGTWSPHANILRLWRSVRKGLKTGRIQAPAGRDGPALAALLGFARGYFGGDLGELRRAKAYLRRRSWTFALRSAFWRARRA